MVGVLLDTNARRRLQMPQLCRKCKMLIVMKVMWWQRILLALDYTTGGMLTKHTTTDFMGPKTWTCNTVCPFRRHVTMWLYKCMLAGWMETASASIHIVCGYMLMYTAMYTANPTYLQNQLTAMLADSRKYRQTWCDGLIPDNHRRSLLSASCTCTLHLSKRSHNQ